MESVKSIPVKVGDAFTIAEYGCADGGTSMPLMYACVKELRTLYGNELEVHINYEDKPENDFKSLFYFLQGKEKAMKQNNKLMASSLQPPVGRSHPKSKKFIELTLALPRHPSLKIKKKTLRINIRMQFNYFLCL